MPPLPDLIIALDSGSPVVSVALGRLVPGEPPLAVRAAAVAHSSRQLLAFIDQVLAEAGALPADLGGVVALRGPGSFTGLRIGLATALGLQQALGIRALALPTLAVLAAAGAAPGAGPVPGAVVIAAVDALRGDWSAQAFLTARPPTMTPQPLGDPALLPGSEIARLLPPAPAAASHAAQGAEAVVTGWGVERLAAACSSSPSATLASAVPSASVLTPGGERWHLQWQEPEALAPAALSLAAEVPLASWDEAGLTVPLYARPPAITLPRRRTPPGGASPARPPAPAPSLAVRPAIAGDLGRIAELEAGSFSDPWPESVLAAELAHPGSVLLVACRGSEPPLGYACWRVGGGEAELLRIGVERPERGRGVGGALVAAGLGRLRAAAVGSCHLEVRADNQSAQAVYRRLGFSPSGRRRAYYRDGTDALLYRIEL
ncbi:MAG TPA: tRNA (adenosine(37)-N6)-threonylcarbamoyltransferase complex dimerization subunit type 1 TsaB [Thermoanaerobaculia bacterium]|nr:tRNA (adenosine(37)-N6)-threonylcarbamoyltransferase complex dimerization subunit type 1 TsaB [Thermoanaerobaculia bacterium]